MAELVSPGVLVKEKDLTVSVRGDATSIGGIGIMATDGPVNEVITVEDENQLADIFGKPNGTNYQYWFTAANFLLYSNTLKVLRMETTGMKNATGAGAGQLIPNTTSYEVGDGTYGPFSGGQATGLGEYAARWAGAWGNNVKVAWCATAAAFYQAAATTCATNNAVGTATVAVAAGANLNVGDIIYFQQTDGQHYRVTGISSNNVTFVRYPTEAGTGLTQVVDGSSTAVNVTRNWQYYDQFSLAPGTSA